MVNQYYRFVEHTTYTPPSGVSSGCSNLQNEPIEFVSRGELNRWRELDAVYISLEFGYVGYAVTNALLEKGLLEVEEGAYVPQAIEDVFFLLQKVAERSLCTG
jgi:hypothetical protein